MRGYNLWYAIWDMSPVDSSQVREIFRDIVGNENIITSRELIVEAQTATYKTKQKILGIVKPRNVGQVQKIVEIANQKKIPLYVYSTGKNWGYGSRVPKTTNSLLVDLGRMNKISGYSKELGYVTLEPGVTQKQLYDFLKKQKSPFSASFTGSAPDTSVVGNTIERGVAGGPYGFRSRHISELEVVLPSGKCIHTGFGRFANATAAEAYPEGVGPSFNNMFLQSNFGIITKLTMFLVPTPTYSKIIDISVAEEKDLPKYLKLLHTFKFYSSSTKSIAFRNDLHFLPYLTQYPWDAANNKTPLPAGALGQLKKKYDINFAWKAFIAVYGYTEKEVDAQIDYCKSLGKNLKGIRISPLFTEKSYSSGPREMGNSIYWRMKTQPPVLKNLDTDGGGLMRISIAVPFIASDITTVIKTMEKVIDQFKYEPFIEGHCISERAVFVIATIIYDRTMPGEDENVLACHDTLLKALTKKGYYPNRDNGRAMMLLPKSSDDYDGFQATIKTALDANNILSHGRYEIS